jgi:hypothetical protein
MEKMLKGLKNTELTCSENLNTSSATEEALNLLKMIRF